MSSDIFCHFFVKICHVKPLLNVHCRFSASFQAAVESYTLSDDSRGTPNPLQEETERWREMNIYSDITKTIGRTPLVRLNKLTAGMPGTVLAKMEGFNPCHSVKDRIGVSMIDAAEKAGQITPGKGVRIEPSSGHT